MAYTRTRGYSARYAPITPLIAPRLVLVAVREHRRYLSWMERGLHRRWPGTQGLGAVLGLGGHPQELARAIWR